MSFSVCQCGRCGKYFKFRSGFFATLIVDQPKSGGFLAGYICTDCDDSEQNRALLERSLAESTLSRSAIARAHNESMKLTVATKLFDADLARERIEHEAQLERDRQQFELEQVSRAAADAKALELLRQNPGEYQCPWCMYKTLKRSALRCPTCRGDVSKDFWAEIEKADRQEQARLRALEEERLKAEQEKRRQAAEEKLEAERKEAAVHARKVQDARGAPVSYVLLETLMGIGIGALFGVGAWIVGFCVVGFFTFDGYKGVNAGHFAFVLTVLYFGVKRCVKAIELL